MNQATDQSEEEIKKGKELAIEAKRAIAYLQSHRNYKYVAFLGEGNYGWVSLVYDDAEEKSLAVKCTIETSQMELNWWPKLQHDNILPLFEYITLDNCTVFVMPAMRKDILNCVNEPRFYEDEISFGLCRIWLRDLAIALNYLHKQFLCHLDLKLENMFLKEDGHICLGDFSLLSDTREVPKGFYFLNAYESPEHTDWCHETPPAEIAAEEKFNGDQADMWQFGILTIDLLTNLKLSGDRSPYSSMFLHDVWPFVQKILQHKEYLDYMLEKTFCNVLFSTIDYDACHDFLRKILCLEPNNRMSAEQAMEHEFVTVEWPQLPKEFKIPKIIVAEHAVNRSLPKDQLKKGIKIYEQGAKEIMKDGELYLKEVPSQGAADILKRKIKKIQQKKQIKREAMAAESGKNPAKVVSNLSQLPRSEEEISVLSSEPSLESESTKHSTRRRSRTKKLPVIPSTLSKHKKLVARVSQYELDPKFKKSENEEVSSGDSIKEEKKGDKSKKMSKTDSIVKFKSKAIDSKYGGGLNKRHRKDSTQKKSGASEVLRKKKSLSTSKIGDKSKSSTLGSELKSSSTAAGKSWSVSRRDLRPSSSSKNWLP